MNSIGKHLEGKESYLEISIRDIWVIMKLSVRKCECTRQRGRQRFSRKAITIPSSRTFNLIILQIIHEVQTRLSTAVSKPARRFAAISASNLFKPKITICRKKGNCDILVLVPESRACTRSLGREEDSNVTPSSSSFIPSIVHLSGHCYLAGMEIPQDDHPGSHQPLPPMTPGNVGYSNSSHLPAR